MKTAALFMLLCLGAGAANAQIQVQLKFSRLQYIAYEPLIATVSITNRAGRDIDLRDDAGQHWFGFEVTGSEGQPIGPFGTQEWPPLHVEGSRTVTQKINLTPLYPIQDLGSYHIRAHVYFADLDQYFYSPSKVVQITDARPIWKQTVGVPETSGTARDTRSYSLLSNRFSDHTSLYVRVEDEPRGVVYATFSLGHIIAFDEPQAEIDRQNRLHVLHCAAPRTWSYATIGLNGQLVVHSTLVETKTRPRLRRREDGDVVIVGGTSEPAAAPTSRSPGRSLPPDKPAQRN